MTKTFVIGSIVKLTEEAKKSAFWHRERFRNQKGKVVGVRADGMLIVLMGEKGIPKNFYINPNSLKSAD